MARVPLLEKEQASDAFQEIFKTVTDRGGKVLNLFKAMAHCPDIGRQVLYLGEAILRKGRLPPQLRELAILRVGHLNHARYEITQHIPIGRRAGLTDEQIEALPDWSDSSHFNPQEQAVLQFTDEITQNIHVSEETFQTAGAFLSEEQLVELTITAGYYGMVCRVLETLHIELEED